MSKRDRRLVISGVLQLAELVMITTAGLFFAMFVEVYV